MGARANIFAMLAAACIAGCAQSGPGRDPGEIAQSLLSQGNSAPPDDARIAQLEQVLRRLAPEQRARLGRAVDQMERRKTGQGSETRQRSDADRLLDLLRKGEDVSGTIEGRIIDAATLRPIAGRVSVTDRFGMIAGDVGGDLGFWADGRFRVRVLAGRVVVSVSRGRRRSISRSVLVVRPRQTVRLDARIGMPASLDFRSRGWVGCDLRYSVGGPKRLRREANLATAALAARGEGLGALFVTRPWRSQARSYCRGERSVRPESLSARCRALSRSGTLVSWGYQRTSAPPYGRLLGLGLSDWRRIDRYASSPLYPNSLACGEIRRQGGVAVYTDLAAAEPIETAAMASGSFGSYYRGVGIAYDRLASELPFDTVAGPLYDAVELSGSEADERVWFRLLSEGYRVTAIGATGGALESGQPPAERTLLFVGRDASERRMLDAVRKGHAMVTTGPYVFLSIDERGPGDEVSAGGAMHVARVEAHSALSPASPLAKVELIRDGKVVLTEDASAGQTSLVLELPFREDASAWYLARATDKAGGRAWTNPVYFVRGGDGPPRAARTRLAGVVADISTGEALSGTVRVISPDGRLVESRAFAGGRFSFIVPASAAVEVSSPGYRSARVLAFFASRADEQAKAIHTDARGLRASVLWSAATYTEAREAAATGTVKIGLRKR